MPWWDHKRKAQTNLQAAEICHRQGLFDPGVSRAYYSVFHAAIAALMHIGKSSTGRESWGHNQVQAEFNRHLIARRKVFPAELGRIPSDLLNYRHVADYRRISIGQKVAGRCLEKAQRFVSAVENKLEEESTHGPSSGSSS